MSAVTRLEARRPFTVGRCVLGGPQVAICVPLVAENRSDLLEAARRAAPLAPDLVEWRMDWVADLTPERVPALLHELTLSLPGIPLIATNRHPDEGGARAQSEPDRLALLGAAAASGRAALIDLELAVDPEAAAPVLALARQHQVRVIRSTHDFGATPTLAAMMGKLQAAARSGADMAKLAVTLQHPDDLFRLFQAGLEARRAFLDIPAALMAMGGAGGISRLGGGYYGSDLTFAVPDGGRESAPGQMPVSLVRSALIALGLKGRN